MSPVGLGLVWSGYTLFYFGFCSVRGPGVGLFDLIIPGRSVTIPGSASSSGAGANVGTPGAFIPAQDNPANGIYTTPSGSHWVHTPNGDTLEPNQPGRVAVTPGGEGVVA